MSIADKKTKLKKLKENAKNPKLKEYWEMFEKGIAKLEKEIGADAKKGEDILDKAFSDKPKPKAKAKAKPKAKKKTSVSKADAEKELAKKVGKTEEECEDILKQFRDLRAKKKARTKKTSETKAKSKAQGKTEPSGEITPEAVINDATKKVEKKIDKKIEKVEAKAEKTEKPKADATPKAKKEAEKKVEKKVEKETKVVAKDSVDALEGMVKAIMDSLKKYDKATAKLSLIKLRDAIDKEIAKYGDGGMVQGFDIQASLINVGNNSYAKGGSTYQGGGEIKVGDEVGLRFDSIYHKDKLDNFVVEKIENDTYSVRGKKNDNTYSVPRERIIVYRGGSTYARGGEIKQQLRKRFEAYSDEDLQAYNGENKSTLKNWNRKDAIDEAIETAMEEAYQEGMAKGGGVSMLERGGKLYTKEELLKKFKGKFIDTYPYYDYQTQETTYEVRSVKSKVHENHETPEQVVFGYAKGGNIDLFENYETLPKKVRDTIDFYMEKYQDGDYDYEDSKNFLKEMEKQGYTFEYGLDNEPYDLRKMEKGGKIDFSDRTSDDFKLGELVYDTRNKRYGTIIGIYNEAEYEVRLDSDGMQPNEYLRKLGEKGDNGTKKQLFEAVASIEALRKNYPENNYPKLINNPLYAKGGLLRVLKDSGFNHHKGSPKNELKHNRGQYIATIGKDNMGEVVHLDKYTPNTKRFISSTSFDNPKKLADYFNKNQLYAKGGRLDMELLDYNIGGALAVASQVKGVAPKSVDGIDSYLGNKFKNKAKMDDWWNTSPNERKARGYAKGGMSQGYNDKDDESIGMRNRGNKMQSRKDRRDESAGMEKSGGRRKYADVGTMDKGRRKKMEAGGGLGNIAKPFNIQEGMISVGNNVKFFKKGGGLYDNLKIKKGTFTKKAKNRGMTTKAFMKEVLSNPENYTMKTRRQAQLMKNMI